LPKLYRPRWNQRETPSVNARRELPRLIAAYFAHVRDLLAQNPEPAELHRIRLATKRVRYTLELFRSVYGPGLDARLAALRGAQQLLGEVNDASIVGEKLGRSVNAPVRKFLGGRAVAKAREFREYWTKTFDATGREEWWTRYLSH
jgi:CHAD domain-containing protein